MVHIGTVHYRDERWIDVQLRYLERHTHEPYRVYASLDGIDPHFLSRFHYACDHTGLSSREDAGSRIEQKLDQLTAEIVSQGKPNDLLVIMHGDTLPITDWVGPLRRMLAEGSLAAIRREEIGEPIPHWSFIATTVGFWSELGTDWSRGPAWSWNGEMISDTGARLWEVLETRGVRWRELRRSNKRNLHALFFGVYGDLIYHHGAGFRPQMSRYDSASYLPLPIPLRNIAGVRKRIANTYVSRRMFRRIRKDERFYRLLTGDPA